MRPIVTVVRPSVCHDREPCNSGWTDRDSVWVEDSGWSKKNHVDGVQISHGKG